MKLDLNGGGSIELADTRMFRPTLTLQCHFTGLGALKSYAGVGAQWIHFFSEGRGKNASGASRVEIDDAFGITLQADFDMEIANGWYLNSDVKKSFLDTTVTFFNTAFLGGNMRFDHDLDPWIFSVGVGYRFNLFGPRYTNRQSDRFLKTRRELKPSRV